MKRLIAVIVVLILSLPMMNAIGEDNRAEPIEAGQETILHIEVKEIQGSSNSPWIGLFYQARINGEIISKTSPLIFGTGANTVNDVYNVSVRDIVIEVEFGIWKLRSTVSINGCPGVNTGIEVDISQLDVSSNIGEYEGFQSVCGGLGQIPFENILWFRTNTFKGFYNISSETLTGDTATLTGSTYYINGSTDGTGTEHGGLKFSLSSFNRTIPDISVQVDMNTTVNSNVTLNQTSPEVNVTVAPPNVTVEVNVSSPNVSAPNVSVTVPTTFEGANVTMGNLSIPPPVVNVTSNQPPINVSVEPPEVNIEYTPNATKPQPLTVSTTMEVTPVLYILMAIMVVGLIGVGGLALRSISILNRTIAGSEERFYREMDKLQEVKRGGKDMESSLHEADSLMREIEKG